jgi:hypothetical protein
MTTDQFDPIGIVAVLNRHGVRYVVIGGIAAGVQGAIWATTDLDVCHSRSRANLRRLASALDDLEAAPVDVPPDVRVPLDERMLARGDIWTLSTRLGRLDCLVEPAPGLTYATLSERGRPFEGSETYLVASIDDLITMKRTAGRPKDLAQIDLLRAVSDELRADRPARNLGRLKDQISLEPDWDAPEVNSDIAADFEP